MPLTTIGKQSLATVCGAVFMPVLNMGCTLCEGDVLVHGAGGGWSDVATGRRVDDELLVISIAERTGFSPKDPAGHVHVYVHDEEADDWMSEAFLQPSNYEWGGGFGSRVEQSGHTILVSAFEEEARQGAAYVFEWEGGSWQEKLRLHPEDLIDGSWFGFSIAVHGNSAVVGAPNAHLGEPFVWLDQGAAYVYQRLPDGWKQVDRLVANHPKARRLGYNVAMAKGVLAASGRTVAEEETSVVHESVFIFRLEDEGWVEEQALEYPIQYKVTGKSLAMTEDVLAVGAGSQDEVHVYRYDGESWTLSETIKHPEGDSNTFFGNTLSINRTKNGQRLAIGASQEYGAENPILGAAYLYEWTEANPTWTLLKKLEPCHPKDYAYFSHSLSLSGKGLAISSRNISYDWPEDTGLVAKTVTEYFTNPPE